MAKKFINSSKAPSTKSFPLSHAVLHDYKNVISDVDWDFSNIIKVRIFVTDMKEYQKVNEIYAKKFSKSFPARAVLGVKELPLGAHVEIECTAAGEL